MKSALFVWGGWDGHAPELTARLFADIMNAEGYHTELSDTLDVFNDAEKLRGFDLIVPNWTMGTLAGDQEKNLTEAIKAGTGLGGWHGGMGDAFRGSTDYQFMVGGQFVAHPGNAHDYRVNITRSDDPITAGLGDFAIYTEKYYMHVDPSNEVLATATFSGEHAPWIEGTVMPVVWKRKYGAGRVFYCALGHNTNDFEVPEAKEITRRGLLWATR
jgi:type 1 glutamine amidotransferase